MSKLKRMAHDYAIEMVEHNLKNGALHLDVNYIAKQACELAYAMKQELDKYEEDDDDMTKEDILKIIKEHELLKQKPL